MNSFLSLLLILWLAMWLAKRFKAKNKPYPPEPSLSAYELLRAERLYDSPAPQQTAPANGEPLYIGYGDLEVLSPNGQHLVQWLYDGEPPFGDSINLVWIDGRQLSGWFRGRFHAWSPDSEYFTVEKYDHENGGLFVVRVADKHWYRVNDGASVVSIIFPKITFQEYDRTNSETSYIFSGNESWVPIA